MECVGVPETTVQASAAEASISVNINININMNIAASMLPSKSPPSTWHPPAHSVVDPACQHRIVDVEDCPRPRGFIQPLRREHPQPLLRWRPTIVIPFPLATAGVSARMFATHRAAAAFSQLCDQTLWHPTIVIPVTAHNCGRLRMHARDLPAAGGVCPNQVKPRWPCRSTAGALSRYLDDAPIRVIRPAVAPPLPDSSEIEGSVVGLIR
jgi:hypothetical protein